MPVVLRHGDHLGEVVLRILPQRLYDYVAERLMTGGVLVIGPSKFFLPGIWEVDTCSFDFVRVEHPNTPQPLRIPNPEHLASGIPDVFPPEVWPDDVRWIPHRGKPSYVAPPQLYIEPKPPQRFEFPGLDTDHGRRMVRKALWYALKCWRKGSPPLESAPPESWRVPDPSLELRFGVWNLWKRGKRS